MSQRPTLTSQDKAHLVQSIANYLSQEHEIELGQFDLEFLVDHITETFGSFFYNQGLYDAQAVVSQQAEAIADAISMLEKPTH